MQSRSAGALPRAPRPRASIGEAWRHTREGDLCESKKTNIKTAGHSGCWERASSRPNGGAGVAVRLARSPAGRVGTTRRRKCTPPGTTFFSGVEMVAAGWHRGSRRRGRQTAQGRQRGGARRLQLGVTSATILGHRILSVFRSALSNIRSQHVPLLIADY